jgi:protein O-GlcNAc transferase
VVERMGVDVCIDLMGFSAGARPDIHARHPAAVHASFLGYAGTMGADCFDFLIADTTVLPTEEQEFVSEQIVHLPDCYLPADDTRSIAAHTPSRADCGLPDDAFVYCCFNSHYKINPRVFGIWMDLLQSVPRSLLWLADGNPDAVTNLRREAGKRGVDGARLHFAPRLPAAADHLARHALADLFLDTQPFGAHATASDALWAGLPLLTVRGSTFAGRVAASLLTACGLPELVAADLDDYARAAAELARSPHALLRAALAACGQPPCITCLRYRLVLQEPGKRICFDDRAHA